MVEFILGLVRIVLLFICLPIIALLLLVDVVRIFGGSIPEDSYSQELTRRIFIIGEGR
jgi:hypothetical protein